MNYTTEERKNIRKSMDLDKNKSIWNKPDNIPSIVDGMELRVKENGIEINDSYGNYIGFITRPSKIEEIKEKVSSIVNEFYSFVE